MTQKPTHFLPTRPQPWSGSKQNKIKVHKEIVKTVFTVGLLEVEMNRNVCVCLCVERWSW